MIEQLFSKCRLADRRRADEQVKSRQDAVESGAEIGKTGFPAGDLLDRLVSLQLVQDAIELLALGL